MGEPTAGTANLPRRKRRFITVEPDADLMRRNPFDPEPERQIKGIGWYGYGIHPLVPARQVASRDQCFQVDRVKDEFTAAEPDFYGVDRLRCNRETGRYMREFQWNRPDANGGARE
jgi:hypothetical protein